VTINASGWNTGRWGSTLIWGYAIAGVAATACIYDATIVSALQQTTSAALNYEAIITIDGTDISAESISGELRLNGNGGHNVATLELTEPTVVPVARQSEIIVSIDITVSGSANHYTVERFRGKAFEVTKQDRPEGTAYSVICYDAGYQLTIDRPFNIFGYTVYSSSAGYYARQFIDQMLAFAGLSPMVGTFSDFTPWLFIPSQYSSCWDACNQLAAGRTVAMLYVMPSGLVRVAEMGSAATTPFSFPLECQSAQDPDDARADAFNRVRFSVSPVSTLIGYDDTTAQATQGIISKTSVARFCLTTDQVKALGKALVDWSQKKSYIWETPLNPYVTPGQATTLMLKDETTASVHITAVIDTFSANDGFWSRWEGKV
jgi:hypothetical protein